MSATIPRSALLLGWAGVLPFLALTGALALRLPIPLDPGPALVGYGVAILSFMGGAQWGLAVRAPDGGDRALRPYVAAVVPALVAWPAGLLPPRYAFLLLAAGFAALLAYDLWTVRRGEAPAWYGRLRLQLTVAVVALLLGAALVR